MFKLTRNEEIEGLGSAYVYEHNTGCKLIYVKNSDLNRVFTIAFNTLPDNDKGIPHIVEHCVLCGSENFRVKDPFNILDKGSIHTYLNAMTYRDKTVYPIGSTNEKDFKTLMRVYLDAVFRPLMYKNEGIFRQEGWYSDGEGFNGIVLNEMKGVYSDPTVILSEIINKEMFAGCKYSNDSGGNPDYITELSYEEFLDFHKKHYHPSNSVIYLYGDLDIENYLNIIDNEFLSDFEYKEPIAKEKVRIKDSFSVKHRYNTSGKNILSVSYSTGLSSNVVECLMLGMLSNLLCYVEGGNIKEAILSNKLGDRVSCSFDDSGLCSVMDIVVENSEENDVERFKEVINNVFKDIAENGVDEYKLRGVINSIKFYFKEEEFGYKPRGLFYGLLIIKSFLNGDESFKLVRINELFDELEKVDIKELIKKYFVDKGGFGILIADKDVKKQEKDVVEKNNESLIKYQSQVDEKEEIKKLISTKVSDISKEGFKLKYENFGENVFVPLESEDIVYIDLYFDVSEHKNTVALNAYRSIVDLYNEKLSNDLDYYAGGFSVQLTTLQRDELFRPVLLFKLKCLKENVEKCIELIRKVIDVDFENKEKVSRLILENKQGVRSNYIESGNLKAIEQSMAMISSAAAWENSGKGINYYKYLDSDLEIIKSDLKDVRGVFKKGSAFYGIGCKKEDRELITSYVEKLIDSLEDGGKRGIVEKFELCESLGVIIDGNVNFNAVSFNINSDTGVARVVQQIISREYLWDKIRIEGGAYGGGCAFLKTAGYMYSYRDPNFEKTFEVFKRAGEYILNTKYSEEDIERFIIGTINAVDTPIKKYELTRLAMRKFFAKDEKNIATKRRLEILNAKPKDIKEFGERLFMAKIEGFASVGMKKDIEKSNYFKQLYLIDWHFEIINLK